MTAGAGLEWQRPPAPLGALRLDLSAADALGVARTLSTTAGPGADHASGHVLLFGASLSLVFGAAPHYTEALSALPPASDTRLNEL